MHTFDQGLSYVRARTAVIRVLARAGSLTYLLDVFCMWGVRQKCIHGTAPNKKQHDACGRVCVMLTHTQSTTENCESNKLNNLVNTCFDR